MKVKATLQVGSIVYEIEGASSLQVFEQVMRLAELADPEKRAAAQEIEERQRKEGKK